MGRKRTIMIFLEFSNMNCIDELRQKYDPLATKVRPHITLVFPFESELETEKLKSILDNRLQKQNKFEVELNGLSMSGYWLFLNVTAGLSELAVIHSILYTNEFLKYKPAWLKEYIPHITVGQFSTNEELKEAYYKEKGFNETFRCLVDKITVEIIGSEDESIIELECLLH